MQVPTVDPPSFTLLPGEPSFGAFVAQQLLVPFASLVILAIVPGVPWQFIRAGISGQLIEVARCVVISGLSGLLLASAVRLVFPKVRSTGRWIGALPLILLLWAFLSDAFTFSVATALAEVFFPGPNGENWWVFALLTCPAISTLFYSVAMTWAPSRRKSPDLR